MEKIKEVCLTKNESTPKELADSIAGFLDDKKGRDIIIIDLMGKTVIADYFVIASARSTTAVRALAEYVDEKLGKVGIEPRGRDIDPKWVAVDYGCVILHVFLEETRAFYNLERLWADENNVIKL